MQEPALYAEFGFRKARGDVGVFMSAEDGGEERANRDPVRGSYFGGL